jgi:hypothetical protein
MSNLILEVNFMIDADISKLDDVLKHFEGARHLAEVLGVDRKKPYHWARNNRIPMRHRKTLEKIFESGKVPPREARAWHRQEMPQSETPILDGLLGG